MQTTENTIIMAEVKNRLEELRKEIQDGHLSYGEIAELQSLIPYIDKGDVELLEWAGVPEFETDETTDLFNTPELIPEDVRAVFEKYEEPTYETLAAMLKEVEELGYTFDYYLDAVPYDLRKKIETNQ